MAIFNSYVSLPEGTQISTANTKHCLVARLYVGMMIGVNLGDSVQTKLYLVGGWPTPLKNDGVHQLGWLFATEWKKKMFQTTNQIYTRIYTPLIKENKKTKKKNNNSNSNISTYQMIKSTLYPD